MCIRDSSIAYEQGAVNPLRLQMEEGDPSEVFSYSFHLATIRDKDVYKRQSVASVEDYDMSKSKLTGFRGRAIILYAPVNF